MAVHGERANSLATRPRRPQQNSSAVASSSELTGSGVFMGPCLAANCDPRLWNNEVTPQHARVCRYRLWNRPEDV